jgi:hypothetical protein
MIYFASQNIKETFFPCGQKANYYNFAFRLWGEKLPLFRIPNCPADGWMLRKEDGSSSKI